MHNKLVWDINAVKKDTGTINWYVKKYIYSVIHENK